MTTRRSVLLAGGIGLLVAPRLSRGQPQSKTARIGILWVISMGSPRHLEFRSTFLQRLSALGYVEGKTHLFVYRFAQGQAERFPALASELVNLPVDVIVSWGTPASLAAHKATDTIPIVMSAGDPIGAGIVAGLARPGRNVTGMSVQMAEQEGKRLELLNKLLPNISRVAILSNPSNPYCAIAVEEARRGATALSLQFDLMEASEARSLEATFLTLSRIRPRIDAVSFAGCPPCLP